MRIIGGMYKKKKLLSVPGMDTRPTADRLRETLFNILSYDVREAVVLDLFAGTGALGLEALSRGAASCVFIDNSRDALSVIKKNCDACT
ncbi:MAG: RsmD family RNA methyltransferase, partial [Desulfobacteraceae bacterium]